jgi:elongation factor Ts
MDNKSSVEAVIAKFAKDNGGSVKLTDYVRFQLGEGIEKEETDFAAEVAAAVAG